MAAAFLTAMLTTQPAASLLFTQATAIPQASTQKHTEAHAPPGLPPPPCSWARAEPAKDGAEIMLFFEVDSAMPTTQQSLRTAHSMLAAIPPHAPARSMLASICCHSSNLPPSRCPRPTCATLSIASYSVSSTSPPSFISPAEGWGKHCQQHLVGSTTRQTGLQRAADRQSCASRFQQHTTISCSPSLQPTDFKGSVGRAHNGQRLVQLCKPSRKEKSLLAHEI